VRFLQKSNIDKQEEQSRPLENGQQRVPSNESDRLEMSDIECDIDEDVEGANDQGKNINDSFINKLRDISTFNPSGIKSKEKGCNSMMALPVSSIDMKKQN